MKMKRVKIGLLIVAGLLLTSIAFSAQNTSLCGRIVDSATREALTGVNVMVRGTVLGASTDMDGIFCIAAIPPGTYTVDVTMIGYRKETLRSIQVPLAEELLIFMQSTVLEQPNLIVTASKRKQLIENSPVSVDVIDMRAIQSRNVVELDEVLQNAAGFGVTDGQIDLRGSTGWNYSAGSRVLLMVDGHPMINGDTGGINWDLIPVEEVERVEVVKGAGSALYGSNAMAGMVNVITRDPSEKPQTRFRYSWGFYDEPPYDSWRWTDRFYTYQIKEGNFNPENILSFGGLDVSHSQKIGKTGFLLSAGKKTSDEYYQNGDYDRWHVMGKVKYHFTPQKAFDLAATYALNEHGEFIQWISQKQPLEVEPDEAGNRVRYAKSSVRATFRNAINQRLAYTIKGNFYRTDWENDFVDNTDDAVTDRIGSEVQMDYVAGMHAITFGGETTFYQTESKMYGNREMLDLSLYCEDEIEWSALWALTLGSRYDYHRVKDVSTDNQFSPRMGMVYRPAEGTSLRLSVGHGFRAPSIAEIFANTSVSGVRVLPNLELNKAERAWSGELGVRQVLAWSGTTRDVMMETIFANPLVWALNRLTPQMIFDVALFYSRYSNMIDVDLNPELSDIAAVQFMNRGDARISGIEVRLTGSFFNGKVKSETGYTYIDPIDLTTDKILNYRSRHRLNAGLEWQIGKWQLGMDYRYASRIEEVLNLLGSGFEERVPMHVMDARAIVDLGKVNLGFEVKNFRNYQYTLRQRFLEPMRHYMITLRGEL